MTHDAPSSHEPHGHHDAHAAPHGVTIYVMVALALVFLTACSYWTYTPLWPFGDEVAIKRVWMMAVSCTKAMLVILFFMHLKWEANWKWILTVPASMMSLLLVLALVPDIGLRFFTTTHSAPSRQRLTYAASEGVVIADEGSAEVSGEDAAGHADAGH